MQSNSESKFIHLRCHSEYSITDGIVRLGDYVSLAKELELESLAISDLSNIFAAVKFFKLAISKGIKPIIGADVYIENENNRDQPSRLLLICQNKQGYLNLSKLLSKAYTENQYRDRPEIKFEWLCSDLNYGLICLSGFNFGAIGQNLLSQKKEKSVKLARQLKEAFDDRFYLEVQRYELAKKGEEQENLVLSTAQLAYELDIPLVATQPIQFIKKEDFQAHEAKTCIADGYVLGDQRRPKNFTAEQYFKTPEEMIALFDDIPSAISNTLEISKRCNFEFELGNVFLPDFPIPKGLTINEYLEKTAIDGLEKKLKNLYPEVENFKTQEKKYLDRLHFEINVINQMGYAGYFLIVADFINWAKENNVPVGPGRGSGAGSVVAFALGITDLDPLSYNLLFERFLNPERVSMPDFDIDFCQIRRDEVIEYVNKKYGNDSVAHIITFGTLASRAAVRDIGRVLEVPYGEVDSFAKLIPFNPSNPLTLAESIKSEKSLRDIIETDETLSNVVDISLKLEGVHRHASTHAAGVVIGDKSLSNIVPLYKDPNTETNATQFSMKYFEKAGLVKFYFLGLTTLSIINECVALIQKDIPNFSLKNIPLDDLKTFQQLSMGNAVGVFQLESNGMSSVLKQLQPDKFEEIIAVVALFRPGPMDNIPSFCNRKHGRENIDYIHPMLKDVLKETYG